jgi:hypothetical protein
MHCERVSNLSIVEQRAGDFHIPKVSSLQSGGPGSSDVQSVLKVLVQGIKKSIRKSLATVRMQLCIALGRTHTQRKKRTVTRASG